MEVVKYWQTLPKSKQPGNQSYAYLVTFVKDPLLLVKLQPFQDIARRLNSFLVLFQSERPMVPLLTTILEDLIRQLCAKFIKNDILSNAQTTLALIKIDVTDVTKHKSIENIHLGYSINCELKILKQHGKINDSQVRTFKKES